MESQNSGHFELVNWCYYIFGMAVVTCFFLLTKAIFYLRLCRLCCQLASFFWLWHSPWLFHHLESIRVWPSAPGCMVDSTRSLGRLHKYKFTSFTSLMRLTQHWKLCWFYSDVLCSNERPTDAQMRYFGEVLLDKPGFGTRCMVDEPLEWATFTHLCSLWCLFFDFVTSFFVFCCCCFFGVYVCVCV